MIFRVLQATRENPVNNDFVKTCEKYMKQLNIQLTFEQLGQMSSWSVKKLVKQKTFDAAFQYLCEVKSKQSKISHLKYDDLEIQEYLLDGNRNTDVAKFIFKARSMTLNIKTHKKWKYKDILCVGCGVNNETGDEIISCTGLRDEKNDNVTKPIFYDLLFDGTTSEMAEVAKVLMKRLKRREKIIDGLI